MPHIWFGCMVASHRNNSKHLRKKKQEGTGIYFCNIGKYCGMNWEEYSRASERDYSSKGKPSDMQEGLPPGLFLVLAPYSLPKISLFCYPGHMLGGGHATYSRCQCSTQPSPIPFCPFCGSLGFGILSLPRVSTCDCLEDSQGDTEVLFAGCSRNGSAWEFTFPHPQPLANDNG